MKLAISNIAWKYHERGAIYELMGEYGFTGLEIAPSLFVDSQAPYEVDDATCRAEKSKLHEHDIELVSMQSLLFGASGLALFEGQKPRDDLLIYCKKAVDFAKKLDIPNLVFGSPKNRIIPSDMSAKDAQNIAIKFFKALGDYANSQNNCIAMEANAKDYGANFITQTQQAIELIEQVASEGFRLNLDMGTMSLEGEGLDIMGRALPLTNHIHISEGFLKPVYHGDKNIHRARAQVIKEAGYEGYLSIEMNALGQDDNAEHVRQALEFVREILL